MNGNDKTTEREFDSRGLRVGHYPNCVTNIEGPDWCDCDWLVESQIEDGERVA